VVLRVNGTTYQVDLPPQVSLLDALREHLGLTGTKKGCDQGACGACTVLADGERINACLALAVQYADREITTIEGIDDPLQAAFVRNDGLQCGYCTSGQICSAVGMLTEFKDGAPSAVTEEEPAELTDEEIRERMSGNLCRCGAYNGVVDAIKEVAE
jgi:xanthine dehydrogenase YagT iron-sulfur-binding subunit